MWSRSVTAPVSMRPSSITSLRSYLFIRARSWGADGLALLSLILFVNAALGIVTSHFNPADTHADISSAATVLDPPEQLTLASF